MAEFGEEAQGYWQLPIGYSVSPFRFFTNYLVAWREAIRQMYGSQMGEQRYLHLFETLLRITLCATKWRSMI